MAGRAGDANVLIGTEGEVERCEGGHHVMLILEIQKVVEKARQGTGTCRYWSRVFLYRNVQWRLEVCFETGNGKLENVATFLWVHDADARVGAWTISTNFKILITHGGAFTNHRDISVTFSKDKKNAGTPAFYSSSSPINEMRVTDSILVELKFGGMTYSGESLSYKDLICCNDTNALQKAAGHSTTTMSSGSSSSTSSSSQQAASSSSSSGATSPTNTEFDPTCAICLDFLENPLSTPCGHTFCSKCIAGLNTVRSGIKSCPECRREFTQNLCTSNYMLKNLLETLKQNPLIWNDIDADSSKNPEKACFNYQKCKNVSDAYCVKCETHICPTCHENYHNKSALTRGHTLNPYKPLVCADHQESVTDYCNECKKLACVRCLLHIHQPHLPAVISIKAHADNQRLVLAGLVEDIPSIVDKLKQDQKYVKSQIEKLTKRKRKLASRIEQHTKVLDHTKSVREDQLVIESKFDILIGMIEALEEERNESKKKSTNDKKKSTKV